MIMIPAVDRIGQVTFAVGQPYRARFDGHLLAEFQMEIGDIWWTFCFLCMMNEHEQAWLRVEEIS